MIFLRRLPNSNVNIQKGRFKSLFFNSSKSREKTVSSTVALDVSQWLERAWKGRSPCHGHGGSDENGDDNTYGRWQG